MKKQSVDILDEATNFEQQMRWIMFQHENFVALQTLKEGWIPGDPFYPHPWDRLSSEPQYVRWMAELLLDVDFWFPIMEDPSVTYAPLREGETVDDYDEPELIERVRCMECRVDWIGEEPCFVCDEVRFDPRPPSAQKKPKIRSLRPAQTPPMDPIHDELDFGPHDYGVGRGPLAHGWGEHIHAFTQNRVYSATEVRRLVDIDFDGETHVSVQFEMIPRGTHDGDAVFDLRLMDVETFRRISEQMQVYMTGMMQELQPALDRAGESFRTFSRAFWTTHRSRRSEYQRYIFDRWVAAEPPVPEGRLRMNGIEIPSNWQTIAENNIHVPQALMPELPPQQELPPWQRPITEQRRRRT